MNATEEELTEINDVGAITARCIADYFRGDQARDLIRRLKEAGVNMESTAQPTGDLLAGLTFVLTGELESASRKEAGEKLESLGAKVSGSVFEKDQRRGGRRGRRLEAPEGPGAGGPGPQRGAVSGAGGRGPRRQGLHPGPAGAGGTGSGINREAGASAPAFLNRYVIAPRHISAVPEPLPAQCPASPPPLPRRSPCRRRCRAFPASGCG